MQKIFLQIDYRMIKWIFLNKFMMSFLFLKYLGSFFIELKLKTFVIAPKMLRLCSRCIKQNMIVDVLIEPFLTFL
jgi:hypothetical protein